MNKIASMALVSSLILSVTLLTATYCQSPPLTDFYVYVLVWSDNYASYLSLKPAILTYKLDLENEGFSVEIKSNVVWPYLPDNAEGIRELLQNEASTHEIAGVLLVGDIPYVMYNITIDSYPDIFPCDLYYMDLDGNWTDSDGNGIYDGHSSGDGDLGPEIWVGRLLANITGDEDELVINYFDKNHRFRTGELTLPRRALAYLDDHAVWYADEINTSLCMIYGNETTLVTDTETTNATHYKNMLNDTLGYEWLHLEAHGNFKKHAFNTSTSWTYVNFSEVWSIDPHVFFYNLMACDTADYSRTNYIGGAYIFADTYGLLEVSSTKKGKMSNYNDFYEPVANGKCMGQALKEWFEENGELDRFLHYGLTILGDPTLRAPRIYNQTRDVAVTSVTTGGSHSNFTEVYSGYDATINVTVKNEGIFTENITVTVYYDNNTIKNQTVNLFPGADRVLTFIWNVSGVPTCRNYTIKAYAHPIPNETDTDDNTYTGLKVYVRVCGDVNGDGEVDTGYKIKLAMALWS